MSGSVEVGRIRISGIGGGGGSLRISMALRQVHLSVLAAVSEFGGHYVFVDGGLITVRDRR
jgi:hypothetical protein